MWAERQKIIQIEEAPSKFWSTHERFMREHPQVEVTGMSYADYGTWGYIFLETREGGLRTTHPLIAYGNGEDYSMDVRI